LTPGSNLTLFELCLLLAPQRNCGEHAEEFFGQLRNLELGREGSDRRAESGPYRRQGWLFQSLRK
jgi:hypothetical protein